MPGMAAGARALPPRAARSLHRRGRPNTNVDDWVIDPFAGSGTTAFAAMRLARRFVVIENDEKTFEEMLTRLHSHVVVHPTGSHVVNEQKLEVVLSHGHNSETDEA